MRRRPLAGEQPNSGESSKWGCVQKDPARQWRNGAASTVRASSHSGFTDGMLEASGLRGSIHRMVT